MGIAVNQVVHFLHMAAVPTKWWFAAALNTANLSTGLASFDRFGMPCADHTLNLHRLGGSLEFVGTET